ncbi:MULTISPECIES: DUF2529 family protein [Bacillaceae]|uniref:DUF2529 domain-containing protein n=1 Tax=Evansella alkalicola TaxID=745819 RepID=A0ABS6K0G8_9BACI|nr:MULTISPECIES: DUF2529 family protein [Bacillaceae]MBU9724346.1 DUF2529 domain-containing protein [Bacillus alkalicola]
MKIFQTQLQGLLNQIDNNEAELEDAARLVAQSIISDGDVWIYAEDEMIGVVAQAMHGSDSLPNLSLGEQGALFDSMDTLLVFSPHKLSKDALNVVLSAKEEGANIVGVSSESTPHEGEAWTDHCTLHFSTGIKNGLVPTESGNRIGMPHLIVALHYYYGLYFSVMEMLEENEFDFDAVD